MQGAATQAIFKPDRPRPGGHKRRRLIEAGTIEPDCYEGPITRRIVDTACQRLLLGRTMTSILADADMPSPSAFYAALAADPVLKEQVACARAEGAHAMASSTVDIADEARDVRHRIETRRWLAGRYNAMYSDKGAGMNVTISLEKLISDASGATLVVENTTPEPQQALEGPKDTR